MRLFVVEVVSSTGVTDKILSHIEIYEDSVRKARVKAKLMLAPWRNLGATKTRLLGCGQNGSRRGTQSSARKAAGLK